MVDKAGQHCGHVTDVWGRNRKQAGFINVALLAQCGTTSQVHSSSVQALSQSHSLDGLEVFLL